MAYIFLSFADNLDRDSRSKKDFYNISLEKQYELIKKRIPEERRIDSFATFIEYLFPSGMEKKYFISCPNFLREKRVGKDGVSTFLNNVVIRSEKTLSMNSYLPDNQNIILIGDIYEGGKLKMLSVKGIQLIDDKMGSPLDMVISNGKACLSFARNMWSINHVDYNDTYFTPDNILEIVEHCYTVNNPQDVRKTYDMWNEYFNFRKYYLNEQKNRNIFIDNCEYLESYAVNRKEYRMDSLSYDDYILDNQTDFKKGDMIVLSEKVGLAESFPLIRLNILYNKKQFESKTEYVGKKIVNPLEKKIRTLANDNVIISSLNPEETDELGKLISAGYELGDKFKVIKFEIDPSDHIKTVESDYKNRITDSKFSIEQKYKNLISNEVNKFIDNTRIEKESDLAIELAQLKNELASTLERDAKENKDSNIQKEINERIKQIKSQKKLKGESDKEFAIRIEHEIKEIDIEDLYNQRNLNRVSKLLDDGKERINRELKALESTKTRELNNAYNEQKNKEIYVAKSSLEEELDQRKKAILEDETEICFSLYFKPNDRRDVTKKDAEKIALAKYVVYDYRAEKAKLDRQVNALDNFYSGNVKNPYLSTYLFTPEKLGQIAETRTDWTWYLESLNKKQKEAVRKAVASNGVFLLQGPPGTGKTQVIAETVAHLVKDGKKVLISSETHKAIDNVFERLPKIAEIVPIRLLSNSSNKDNEYTPKYLVDNFYTNISTNMANIVLKYKNFQKNKEDFEERFKGLNLLNSKLKKSQKIYQKAQDQILKLEFEAKAKNSNISELKDQIDSYKTIIDTLRRTRRHIEKYNLSMDDDIKQDLIASYTKQLEELFNSDEYIITDIEALVKAIFNSNFADIESEISSINPESNEQIRDAKIKEKEKKMRAIDDECDGEIDENKEYQKLRREWMALKKEAKASNSSAPTLEVLNKIFNYNYLVANKDIVITQIESKKNSIMLVRNDVIDLVDNDIEGYVSKQDSIQNKINSITKEIRLITDQINEIEESKDVQDIQNTRLKLETQIDTFFKEFEILEPYKDVDNALEIIALKFKDLEENYAIREQENKEKIPMYDKISKYLAQDDVIEDDRKYYTKDLFESANVFGITCTSNDRFTSNNNNELGDFDLGDIDFKSIGIDVVIIDEVSKSSFIELLIPILYGKTVILVGDHRQLPPMYEFAKMRNEEFEGLDENIINPDLNKKFTVMYEECFFKTLFERIPDDHKTMLEQQYRCHEHIMKVFNHFYHGELRIGFNGQNNTKKHGLELISNGRKIIQPDKHVYFVNCKQYETRDNDSTSIYNMGEAKVVVEFLKKLKQYYKNNPNAEQLSIGVICTYGDQAKKIKELMKSEKIKNDDFKKENEKLIVSTVDDFQGDERDIIILSLVRNPQDPSKSNPGFILAYQRINVALSRARKLLFVAGNRRYIEQRGVIDLPDVYGREKFNQRNFRVYEEIIDTIERYGSVLEDEDILESKEGKINA